MTKDTLHRSRLEDNRINESLIQALENTQDIRTQEILRNNELFLIVTIPIANRSEFDRPWKSIFIEWLRRGLTIEKAAHLAGISRRHAYLCRKNDRRFRKAWALARENNK